MKSIVIYHKNCQDGFGAAYAAWKYLGDAAEYVPMNYGDTPPDVIGRHVFVLDFSFPRDVTERFIEESLSFIWLDHHKTAFEAWCDDGERELYERRNGADVIVLNSSKSGALLAWEFFHTTPAPAVIKHIDDRDRWQWAMPGSREVNAAINAMQPWTFEQWDNQIVNPESYEPLVERGSAVLSTIDAQVAQSVKNATGCVVHGSPGRAVNTPVNISEVGNMLAKVSGTYGLVWYWDQRAWLANCSLRSIGDYDVSVLAKNFGGGGHKNAAGFRVPMAQLLEFLK